MGQVEKREEPSREGWGRSKAAEGLAGADSRHGQPGGVTWVSWPVWNMADTLEAPETCGCPLGARWQTGHPHVEPPAWVTQPGLLVSHSFGNHMGFRWTSEGPGRGTCMEGTV